MLKKLLTSDKKIMGAKVDLQAEIYRVRMEQGNWLPSVDVTMNKGFENITGTDPESNTNLSFSELDVSLTQTIWDFGATNVDIKKADLVLLEKELTLQQQLQESLVDGVEAFLEVKRSQVNLDFAQQSEFNIKRVTGLEEIILEEGAGLSSDVLEAKKQLASAQTKRLKAEGKMQKAINTFYRVFNYIPKNVATFENMDFAVLSHLPVSIDTAIAKALVDNLDIKLAKVDVSQAEQDSAAISSSAFFPKITGTLEKKWKNDVAGIIGAKGEFLGKVELTFPISLGLTSLSEYKASIKDEESAKLDLDVEHSDVDEKVKNAWQKLLTSTLTWQSLRNQAYLSAASLELVRQEKALGNRSQINVLSAETALINAQSDASSARIDILIDAFSLLALLGNVSLESLNMREGYVPGQGPASDIAFHQKLSTEPVDRVVEGLQKIAANATAINIESPIAVDEGKGFDKMAIPHAANADSMLSEEELALQKKYSISAGSESSGTVDSKVSADNIPPQSVVAKEPKKAVTMQAVATELVIMPAKQQSLGDADIDPAKAVSGGKIYTNIVVPDITVAPKTAVTDAEVAPNVVVPDAEVDPNTIMPPDVEVDPNTIMPPDAEVDPNTIMPPDADVDPNTIMPPDADVDPNTIMPDAKVDSNKVVSDGGVDQNKKVPDAVLTPMLRAWTR